MAAPDFLCIGAQKAGTTWLDTMMRGHSQIWCPPVKELQFFNQLFMSEVFHWTDVHRSGHAKRAIEYVLKNEPINWDAIRAASLIGKNDLNLKWYEQIFDCAPPGLIKGEFTPEYSLLSAEAVKFIMTVYPNLKIIFIMREPVSRALSGIQMRLSQQGFNEKSNQDEIDRFIVDAGNDWDVVERGNYEKIISIWARYVSAGNFLILLSEDLKNHPETAISKVAEFLEVDKELFSKDPRQSIHVGKKFNFSEVANREVMAAQKQNSAWYSDNKAQFKLESE